MRSKRRTGANMGNNPKIMVIHLKGLIYTIAFVVLALLLLFILVYFFLHNGGEEASDASYVPGTYTSSVTIGSIPLEVSVKVDSDKIIDVSLTSAGETVEAVYPMLSASMNTIKGQVISSQSVENIHLTDYNQYTGSVLLEAISMALEKAIKN